MWLMSEVVGTYKKISCDGNATPSRLVAMEMEAAARGNASVAETYP